MYITENYLKLFKMYWVTGQIYIHFKCLMTDLCVFTLFSELTANGSLFSSSAVSDRSLSHYHLKYTDTKNNFALLFI